MTMDDLEGFAGRRLKFTGRRPVLPFLDLEGGFHELFLLRIVHGEGADGGAGGTAAAGVADGGA